MAKTISITCYGETKLWTSRKKAIDFYQRAIAACEGSERDRYTNIYLDLRAGKDVCSDGCED